jgi:hypothetical protein
MQGLLLLCSGMLDVSGLALVPLLAMGVSGCEW